MPHFEHNNSLRDLITLRLDQFKRIGNADKSLTAAAVVIGIASHSSNGSACTLLTRRSSKLRKHAGQYALPGGKVDASESIVEAALRELDEELGLKLSPDSVLGQIDDMPTQSGFNITPVVVWIDSPANIYPNPDEVAAVYHIPLTELEDISLNLSQEDDNQDIEPGEPAKNNSHSTGNDVMSIYVPSVGTTVYSPTAAIIYQFREVALLGKDTRVAHFGQPRFAWR